MSSAVGVLVFAAFAFPMHVLTPVSAAAHVQTQIFATSAEVTVASNGMMVTTPQVRMVIKRGKAVFWAQ